MQLIAKNDPRYFSQTCDKPYDRHHYKIVCQTKSFVVESWEEVQEYWWNNCVHLGLKEQLLKQLTNQRPNQRVLNNDKIMESMEVCLG
tara:strand:+ start:137 stop:400 length:264 start_codon:yes stop_codon:yes gene_type:complete